MADLAVQALAQALAPLIEAMQNQQNRQVELSTVPLPFFNGGTHEDPINWIDEFEWSANANNITNERKIEIVPAYLRGVAATWFQQRKLTNQNWPTSWKNNNDNTSFYQTFITQFRTNAQILAWQQQLRLRVQGVNEDVTSYAEDIRVLLRKIDPTRAYPATYYIEQFVKGLKPEVAFHVNKSNPNTLDEAITEAISTESSYRQTYQNPLNSMSFMPQNLGIPFSVPNPVNDMSKAIADLTEQVKKLSTQNNRSPNTHPNQNKTCYNCGKNGHIARDCRLQRKNTNSNNNNTLNIKCFKCNKMGHYANSCTERNANNRQPANLGTNITITNPDNNLLLQQLQQLLDGQTTTSPPNTTTNNTTTRLN